MSSDFDRTVIQANRLEHVAPVFFSGPVATPAMFEFYNDQLKRVD